MNGSTICTKGKYRSCGCTKGSAGRGWERDAFETVHRTCAIYLPGCGTTSFPKTAVIQQLKLHTSLAGYVTSDSLVFPPLWAKHPHFWNDRPNNYQQFTEKTPLQKFDTARSATSEVDGGTRCFRDVWEMLSVRWATLKIVFTFRFRFYFQGCPSHIASSPSY